MRERERSTVRVLLVAWLVVAAVLALAWLLVPEAEPARRQVQARYEVQPVRSPEGPALVAPSTSSSTSTVSSLDAAAVASAEAAEIDSWWPPMAKGQGRLFGTVTVRETGAPLAGVLVQLHHMGNGWRWSRERSALSGPDGTYEVLDLPEGAFEVEATGAVAEVRRERPIDVRLAAGEAQRLDLDVSMAGRVWGTVTGADGAPVKRAKVLVATGDSVVTQMASMATSNDRLMASTDERGEYVVHGVPFEHELRVWFDEEHHAPTLSPAFMLHPSRPQLRVDVSLLRGSTVSGRVVDPKGLGIVGAEVKCFPRYGALFTPMRRALTVREAMSGDGGRFDLGALPAGDYQVLAFKNGFEVVFKGVPVYPDGRSDLTVEVRLEPVNAGDHAVLGVVTDPAGAPIAGARVGLASVGLGAMSVGGQEDVTGPDGAFRLEGVGGDGALILTIGHEDFRSRVVDEVPRDERMTVVLERAAPLRGVVLLPDGAPSPAFRLRVVRLTGDDVGLVARLGLVGRDQWFQGPDGAFELDDVPPGRALLEAEAQGFAPGRLEVEVRAGSPTPAVTLRLPSEGARIRGRVTAAGAPVAGARVNAVEVGQSGGVAGGLLALDQRQRAPRGQVTTDARGEFVLERLVSGELDVEVTHADHAPARRRVTTRAGATEELVLALGVGGTIVGRVSPGVMITVAGPGFSAMASADEDGAYRVARVPPGEHLVRAVASDVDRAPELRRRSVQVVEGREVRVDFLEDEPEGRRVKGKVATPLGEGSLGLVLLRLPGGPPPDPADLVFQGQIGVKDPEAGRWVVGEALVQPDGRWVIEGVPPGRYTLDVHEHTLLAMVSGGPAELRERRELVVE